MRGVFWTPWLLLACEPEVKTPVTDTDEVVVTEQDLDGDGYLEGDDCDDSDNSIYPGAVETCDGLDNNCDGDIDEGVTSIFYTDEDEDGFGDPNNSIEACDALEGTVPNGNDCDDSNANVYPSAEEVCDEVDNDCNGEIDEDIPNEWFVDNDGDGYGDVSQIEYSCNPGPGYASQTGDCDDNNAAVFPNAEEICDGVDNDCNGQTDEGLLNSYFVDADLDGFGDETVVEACELTEGLTTQGGDCDDAASQINPDSVEMCSDNIDNNCDGMVDDPSAFNATAWYLDNDGDGVGESSQSQIACDAPTGFVSTFGDCDDNNIAIYPNAPELCDGQTNDCSASTLPSNEIDNDGDGYVECTIDVNGWLGSSNVIGGDDCDDNNADHHALLTWYFDNDGDGYGISNAAFTVCIPPPSGYVLLDGDCNDSNDALYPNAVELCDGQINDCGTSTLPSNEVDDDGDGYVDCSIDAGGWDGTSLVIGGDDCDDADANHHDILNWRFDSDGDGFGDPNTSFSICVPPPNGYVLDATDCDDTNGDSYPNATEICDGQLNDCTASFTPLDEVDDDGDGYVECIVNTTSWNGPFGTVGGGDCNDTDPNINPGAVEVCSGVDMNCDYQLPEVCSSCLEIKQVGSDSIGSGVYTIDTTSDGEIDVYCEMDTDGGGWTLLQRTVWDFSQSSQLLTSFSSFYNSSLGSPQSGNAHRLKAPLWLELNIELDHMLKHTPRDSFTGGDCTPLYYLGSNGTFSLTSSSLNVNQGSGFTSTVSFFSDGSFDALTGGNSRCSNNYNAVPWFYTGCCTTCPTFQGSYYNPARPMASYLDGVPDYYGNTTSSGCPSGASVSSIGYEGINSMEYFIR